MDWKVTDQILGVVKKRQEVESYMSTRRYMCSLTRVLEMSDFWA